jgi:GNAT superfamily N-acetyltransferase
VILRQAQPDELDAVGTLTLQAYTADGYVTADDGYAAELSDAAQRATEADLMVALDAATGALQGTVTFCLNGSPYAEVSLPGEAEFRMLAVAPPARGRGVGLAMVRWCIDRAREQGCTALVLSSLDSMHTAHRLYERLGFARLPDRDWFPNPDIKLLAYGLELAP